MPPSSQIAQADIFGRLSPPPGVAEYNQAAGGANAIGIIVFFSALIRVATIIAGVWILFNFILAGYDYVTSNGDTGAHKRVVDRITMSVIGLVIIVLAYTITAVLSALLFGDAGFILNPQICGPGETC
jgi:hypothetical protein